MLRALVKARGEGHEMKDKHPNGYGFGKEGDCVLCYPREQGTHGPIVREWSSEWSMYIAVCTKHSFNAEDREQAIQMGRSNK